MWRFGSFCGGGWAVKKKTLKFSYRRENKLEIISGYSGAMSVQARARQEPQVKQAPNKNIRVHISASKLRPCTTYCLAASALSILSILPLRYWEYPKYGDRLPLYGPGKKRSYTKMLELSS